MPVLANVLNTPYFNSHAHVERDKYCLKNYPCVFDFNSHAHVERDFLHLSSPLLFLHFNSHAHVERDETG